jgi:hypothetical protein
MSNFSPRRVYWGSQETTGDFAPTATNTAGSMDLTTQGILRVALPARGQMLIWSTVDLWGMAYQGGDFVYGFQQLGNNCGIVSRQAAVVLDGVAYWMGHGKFFMYNGYVSTLDCEVADYVFGSFNESLIDWVWAYVNPRFNEITWHYASNGASELDRYVTYNYVEKWWTYGTLGRTCGITLQEGISSNPVLIDASGNIYDHETGTTMDGTAPYLESGPMQIDEGDNVVRVQKVLPDDKTVGDVNLTLYAAIAPDAAETSQTVSLTAVTDARITGRQIRMRLQQAVANAWRVGKVRLGYVLGGRR